jgi:D-serine deaminase-like pyridoxal phosphate-dependent protein
MEELRTPAALLDLDRLERNASWMLQRAETLGVRLRPHVKTHKSVDVARLQTRGQFGGITVSTFAEADAFVRGGFRDITWAVPIPLSRIPDAGELAHRVERLQVLVDHALTVEALSTYARSHSMQFDVLLKIDCGNHRAGVNPASEDGPRLAQCIASSPELRFRGVLAHAGHAYDATTRAEVETVAEQERDVTVGFADRLRRAGIEVETVSIGSTPTMAVVQSLPGVTEIRPGNYALFDVFQATLGSCTLDDVALSVLTTVVGVYPDRNTFVVDAGALALSKDPGARQIDPDSGYGVVVVGGDRTKALPLRVRTVTQEHGVVVGLDRAHGVNVGTRMQILPNHSCLAAANFDAYSVIRKGKLVDRWALSRGWNI